MSSSGIELWSTKVFQSFIAFSYQKGHVLRVPLLVCGLLFDCRQFEIPSRWPPRIEEKSTWNSGFGGGGGGMLFAGGRIESILIPHPSVPAVWNHLKLMLNGPTLAFRSESGVHPCWHSWGDHDDFREPARHDSFCRQTRRTGCGFPAVVPVVFLFQPRICHRPMRLREHRA